MWTVGCIWVYTSLIFWMSLESSASWHCLLIALNFVKYVKYHSKSLWRRLPISWPSLAHLSHGEDVCQQDRTRHMPRGMCDFCRLPALSQVRSHLTFQKFFGNLYMQVCRCPWYLLLPMSNLAYLLYLKADGKWLPLWDAAFWNQQFFCANREAVRNYLLLSTRQRSSCCYVKPLLRFKYIERIKATKKSCYLCHYFIGMGFTGFRKVFTACYDTNLKDIQNLAQLRWN